MTPEPGGTLSPFQRLTELLDPITPAVDPIIMTIGEPRHPFPAWVKDILAEHVDGFGRYPQIRGLPEFRSAIYAWLSNRYPGSADLLSTDQILPLNGSRDGLFLLSVGARDYLGKENPVLLMPNPHYQTYGAGARAAGLEPYLLPASDDNFGPDLNQVPEQILARAVACVVASPIYPQGTLISTAQWRALISAARRHQFILCADECYSELYRDTPPPGLLDQLAGDSVAQMLVINSLSKRSSIPGLRCGFAAGDGDFIAAWARFRNQAAPQVPDPLQHVAIALYQDEVHVAENRRLYNQKFELAEQLLSAHFTNITPPAGFFLWLDVSRFGDAETVVKALWQHAGLKTVPGGYLAQPDAQGHNPAEAYIRLSLVDDLATTETALTRLNTTLTAL